MDAVTMQVTIPQEKYDLLSEIARERQKSAVDVSVEAILDFVEREAALRQGREILLTMPRRAAKAEDSPADLARHHDRYLYDEE